MLHIIPIFSSIIRIALAEPCLLFDKVKFLSGDRKNGFTIEEDPHALPGNRFRLKAVPFSKNITFGVEGGSRLLH